MFFSALCVAAMLSAESAKLYEPGNLVAWCVVPFDAKKRGPAERAEMLQRLGFTKFAYDWRAEHLPTFEQEVIELRKRNIELTAVWFPAVLNADAKALLAVIAKHKLTPQLWVMVPEPAGGDLPDKVKAAAKALEPVADAAAKLGCRVSLYNHGGWCGHPHVLMEVVDAVRRPHVGIVYNYHHGHAELLGLSLYLAQMRRYLHAVNINGMHPNGDRDGRKIEVLGEGPEDLRVLRAIGDSGYRGPIGILGHTDDDAEDRLADNLAGLARLRTALAGGPPTPRVLSRTGRNGAKPEVAVYPDRRSFTYGPRHPGGPILVTLDGDTRPMDGVTTTDGDFTRFTPRFKLTVGTPLRVTAGGVTQRFVVPADRPPAVATVIHSVSGLRDRVPVNTLRIYLDFSRPMTRGEGLKHVHLTTKDGDPVPNAFLDTAEELWSANGRRLTLLFDPARVKRELAPREELGPILEIGRDYRLSVDAAWPDENGFALGAAFTKDFTAVRADEEPVDPKKWRVVVNKTNLWVDFEKPLDEALTNRMIWFVGLDGKADREHCGGDYKMWYHYYDKPLPPGDYLIRVDTRLEDPCGNRVGRAFEFDPRKPADDVPEFVDLPFTVK